MSSPRLVIALLALGLAAGCASTTDGRPGGTGSTTPRSRPLDAPAGQIVLQVSRGPGGLTPFDYWLGNRPEVTVYGDGTAYVLPRSAENRTYPGRPLAFVRGRVPLDRLQQLARYADGSGLFTGADYGMAKVTDAGGTSVVFRPTRAGARTASVYALDIESADLGVDERQRQNRRALRTFAARVYDSVQVPDGDAMPWAPARVDVSPASQRDLQRKTDAPWPGPPVSRFVRPTEHRRNGCGVLSGRDAARVWAAARTHSTINWTVGPLIVRALLPGERGCD